MATAEAKKKVFHKTVDEHLRGRIDTQVVKPALLAAFKGEQISTFKDAHAVWVRIYGETSESSLRDSMERCGISFVKKSELVIADDENK